MMKVKTDILLVEDDLSFGSVLKSYLELNDFMITWIDDGKNAVEVFTRGKFGLCILDVMLPGVDGFTIAKEIRKLDSEVPLLFLTAKSLREDILKGYKIGADDYITKPFDTEVLLYKIKAILKRKINYRHNLQRIVKIGLYTFNPERRELTIKKKVHNLSPREAELLIMLFENKNRLLNRDIVLREIWGEEGYFTTRSMDVFITKLRKYLSDDPKIEIRNIHGTGYILEVKEPNK